ncbi:MAG: hypothetical protein IIU83_09775 [Fibrobacteraceae bacterium]|nr:hypothetical protein [Fibrobacteraceae bacterium]
MKIKFLYLIAALVLFANCSESPSDPTPFTEEISTENSSDMDSSTSISSSSVFESSSSNQVSSSSILDSSTEGPSVSSSSVTPSSSSSIFQRSSSSKRHNDLVEPDAPLSSSGSGVATIPLRSFIDSNETRTVNLRVLYPAEEGKLDTGFFSLNQCFLYEDGSFKCKQGQCMENVGGTISVPYGGITIQVDYHDNDSSAYGRYFHESTETTLLFDVNLGDSAITSYIPYSNIPEFDKANVKSHLETLSANGCEVLFRYEGYYRLYAEGLPEGIILYHDGSGLNPTVRYSPFASANSEDFEKITEHYTSLSNPETTDSIINEIPSIQSLVDYCEQEHGSHCNNGLFDVFTEKKFADYPYYRKDSIEYSVSKNEYGCGVVAHSYYKEDMAGYCHGWELPDLAKRYSSRLINISAKVPTGPIYWTLIYKDQYGRSGSMQITSEFK